MSQIDELVVTELLPFVVKPTETGHIASDSFIEEKLLSMASEVNTWSVIIIIDNEREPKESVNDNLSIKAKLDLFSDKTTQIVAFSLICFNAF